jgi:hypothetical protein
MENSKWKEDLRNYFKNYKEISIDDEIEIVSKALNEWINFIKKESDFNITSTRLEIVNLKSEFEISNRIYTNPFKIELIIEHTGKFVTIKYPTRNRKIEIEILEKEIEIKGDSIINFLTKTLINYAG